MSAQAGSRKEKKKQVVLSVTCWHSPKEETSLRAVDVYASCLGQSVFPSSHSWRRQNQKMRANLRKLLTFLDCVVKVKKSWWFSTSTCCTNFSLAFYLQKTYSPTPTPRFHFTSLCFFMKQPYQLVFWVVIYVVSEEKQYISVQPFVVIRELEAHIDCWGHMHRSGASTYSRGIHQLRE